MVFLCRKSNDKADLIDEGDDENDLVEQKKNLNIYDSSLYDYKVNFISLTLLTLK